MITTHCIEEVNLAPDPYQPGREVAYEGCIVVRQGTGASCVVLPDGRVLTQVVQSAAEAEALAAARVERDGADLLAADAKPSAHAVADALIAAGYGGA